MINKIPIKQVCIVPFRPSLKVVLAVHKSKLEWYFEWYRQEGGQREMIWKRHNLKKEKKDNSYWFRIAFNDFLSFPMISLPQNIDIHRQTLTPTGKHRLLPANMNPFFFKLWHIQIISRWAPSPPLVISFEISFQFGFLACRYYFSTTLVLL